MNKEDKILEMLQGITDRLDKLEEGQAQMKEDLAQLKEQSEITRVALDRIIDWSDRVSNMAGYPLP